MVKDLSTMQDTWVQSLGQEDSPREEKISTLVFLPGEFHGQKSLVGYSPWGYKELDWVTSFYFDIFAYLFYNCSGLFWW